MYACPRPAINPQFKHFLTAKVLFAAPEYYLYYAVGIFSTVLNFKL